MAYTYYKTTN